MAKLKITQAQALAALQETKGTIFLAAKRLGCSARTLLRYKARFPRIQEAVTDARGELVDTSELKLWQAVQDGQPWAIRLVLQTQGADRGYGKQLELSGTVKVEVKEMVIATRDEAKAALALLQHENEDVSANGQAG